MQILLLACIELTATENLSFIPSKHILFKSIIVHRSAKRKKGNHSYLQQNYLVQT